jgi:hypothetical protein
MMRRTRTLLFVFFGIFFLLAAPSVILYSQGYRLDWETKQITQVGAFYFDVTPNHADIFINDKFAGKTGRFVGTSLSQSLPPNTYHIRVSKDGHHSWEKNLQIEPKQVTEARGITLLPLDPDFEILVDNVEQFWLAPNGREILLYKKSEDSLDFTIWDIKNQIERNVYSFHLPSNSQGNVNHALWSSSSELISFQVETTGNIQTFLYNTTEQSTLSPISFFGETIHIVSSPFQSNQILSLSSSGILSTSDYEKGHVVLSSAIDVVTFAKFGNGLVWLGAMGNMWKLDSLQSQPEKLPIKPFTMKPTSTYELLEFAGKIFLQEENSLFSVNEDTETFELLFTSVFEISLSPDGRKLALLNGQEIWLLYLQEEHGQPTRAKGDKVFLTRFSEEISNLGWLNSYSLLFTTDQTIKTTEIDNRDQLNIFDIAQFSRPDIFWQSPQATLYVQSENQLRASAKLIP